MRTMAWPYWVVGVLACSPAAGSSGEGTWSGTFGTMVSALAGDVDNTAPSPPLILEPELGRVFSPGNVHMETGRFSDPDAGDQHRCTDWEIWTVSPLERVWSTLCISGPLAVHTHLGDGTFEKSHARKRQLLPQTLYSLRVRFRDSSGAPGSEWSEWSERSFETGALSEIFPMLVLDVLPNPRPMLRTASGRGGVPLPGGSSPASVRLERVDSSALLIIQGGDSGNEVLDFDTGVEHVPIKAVVHAGLAPLELPEVDLAFSGEDGLSRTIYFPALELEAQQSATFWLAENGGTYTANAGEEAPVFSERRRESDVPWKVEPDFQAEVVARGFTLPVSIAFVPQPGEAASPLFYVAELYGGLKTVRQNGTISDYTSNILDFTPTGIFPGSGEQGVGSVAVDPKTGDLFVSLVYSSDPNDPNAVLYGAIDRFVSDDGGLTAARRYRILDMAPEPQAPAHQPSNISFGPDGYLYVHTGDGLYPEMGQDLSQFRGKILRMTRAGAAVGRNPYYNSRDGITARDYVYASGIRNAYGGAWRKSDSAHYFVENGPSVDRMARLVYGRNYAWDGSDQSMLKYALYNWNPSTSPVNITFVEPGVFQGSGFPEPYHERAYVTLFCCGGGPGGPHGKAITELTIDSAGQLADGPRAVAYYSGFGVATPIAIAAGPDGIYYSDFFGEADEQDVLERGAILRLKYKQPEAPPDCDGDGVSDSEELAADASRDCTFNGLPDECDIAAGREADCDLDGEPDRCQVTQPLSMDFDDGAAPFELTGTARALAGAVRLTPADPSSLGSAVLAGLDDAPLKALRIEFDMRISGGPGADGLSFAAFDSALHPELPIFGEDGPGTHGAFVVKLNTFDNGDGANNVQILSDGRVLGSASPSCRLNDDLVHRVRINFTGQNVNVALSCSPEVYETIFDAVEVPGFQPFVADLGFGGRTGGLVNEHWVDNVVIWVRGENDDNADGTPDECQGADESDSPAE
jgi:glucose/arabinose dehydrogenase